MDSVFYALATRHPHPSLIKGEGVRTFPKLRHLACTKNFARKWDNFEKVGLM